MMLVKSKEFDATEDSDAALDHIQPLLVPAELQKELTMEDEKRGEILAKPFNAKFYDEADENSESMYPRWKDADGLVFLVIDDFTGSVIYVVHEKDLGKFFKMRRVTNESPTPAADAF